MKPDPAKSPASDKTQAERDAEEKQAVEIFARRLDQAQAAKSNAGTLINSLARN